MKFSRLFPAILFLLFSAAEAVGQQRVSVAFYNVENLFDTFRSPFYDDGDFTPGGRYCWDSARYERKLRNIARVLDDMGADVVGLAEVENEQTVRDLVQRLGDDYNYIHRTSSDSRGIDLAMLYRGDRFFPEKIRQLPSGTSREFLFVSGELVGERVNILVCHLPSRPSAREYRAGAMARLRITADSLMRNDPEAALVVMGDFNSDPGERIFRKAFGRNNNGFYDRLMMYGGADSGYGFGSYAYDGRWYLFDNIMLSFGLLYGEGLRYERGGVFVREYMLTEAGSGRKSRKGYPFRTITSGVWTGGYSDHLPVFVVLAK